MLKRPLKSKHVTTFVMATLFSFISAAGAQAIAATSKKKAKVTTAKAVKPVRYFRGKVITGKNPVLNRKVVTARPVTQVSTARPISRQLPGPRLSAQPSLHAAKTQVYDSNDEYSLLSKDTPLTLEDEFVRGSDYKVDKSKASLSGTSSISELQLKADPKPKAEAKRWGVMLDTWNEFNMEKNEYGEADVEASNTIRVSYAINPELQVQATTEFGNSWGRTQTGEENFKFFDPWFGLQGKNLGKLPWDLSLSGNFRVYLPLSEDSQSQDQIVQLRAGATISKAVGPVSFGYTGSPRFFAHEFPSHIPEGKDSPVGHLYFRYMHTIDFSWTISKLFGFYTKNGLDHRYFYGDAQYNLPENYQERFVSETGISFSGLDPLSITVGLTEGSRDFLRQNNDFSLYRPEDTQAFFEATLVF